MSKENILITARYLPHGLCVILLRSGFSNGLEFPLLEEYRNSLLIRKRDLQTNKQVCNTDWIENASGRDAPCDQNHLIPEKPRSAAVAFAALCFISGSIHQLLSEQHGTWHCSVLRAWTFFPPNPGRNSLLQLPSSLHIEPRHCLRERHIAHAGILLQNVLGIWWVQTEESFVDIHSLIWGHEAQKNLISCQTAKRKAVARQGTEASTPQGSHHKAGLVLFPRLGSSLVFQCNWVQEVFTVAVVVFKHGLLQNNLNQHLKNEVIFFPAYRTWFKMQRNMDHAPLEVQQQCLALLRPFLSFLVFHYKVVLET